MCVYIEKKKLINWTFQNFIFNTISNQTIFIELLNVNFIPKLKYFNISRLKFEKNVILLKLLFVRIEFILFLNVTFINRKELCLILVSIKVFLSYWIKILRSFMFESLIWSKIGLKNFMRQNIFSQLLFPSD